MLKYVLPGALVTSIMGMGFTALLLANQLLLAMGVLGVGTFIVFRLGQLDGAAQAIEYIKLQKRIKDEDSKV